MREGCDRSLCCHVGAPSPPPAPPVHGTALADTRRVTVTTAKIERTGPSIRAALAEFAPAECEQFEAEFQQALGQAARLFELASLDAVLDRWWGIAAIRTNPLNEPEHELVAHAQAGGYSGWVARNEDGRGAQR